MKTKHNNGTADLPVKSPKYPEPREFMSAPEAVSALQEIYSASTKFLLSNFQRMMAGEPVKNRYRAYYPSIQFTTTSYANVDLRLAYGHVAGPGDYFTTITRPDLFADYLKQIELLINNHGVPVTIGISDQPMPLHFAIGEGLHIDGSIHSILNRPLRDIFDAPDLVMTDDKIANGLFEDLQDAIQPLAPFTAPRIDYLLHRLAHYTATSPSHFQNFVLFTNYQFYMDEFVRFAHVMLDDPDSGYTDCVGLVAVGDLSPRGTDIDDTWLCDAAVAACNIEDGVGIGLCEVACVKVADDALGGFIAFVSTPCCIRAMLAYGFETDERVLLLVVAGLAGD